jgi:hypothetical protein
MGFAGTMSLSIVGLCLPIALVLAVFSKYFLASCRPRNFPPGPPTLPFIGNISQVPRVKAFLRYASVILPRLSVLAITTTRFHGFRADYGSIVGLKLGSQSVVILNSYEHVRA